MSVDDGMVFDKFELGNDRARAISVDSLVTARLFPRVYDRFLEQLGADHSADALAGRQAVALQSLLRHAVTNVPAYRAVPAPATVEPGALDQALAGFPLLHRDKVRDCLVELCDDELDPNDCVALATSGTTGTRLRVIADSEHLVRGHSSRLLLLHRQGIPTQCRVIRPGTWFLGWFEYAALAYGLGRKVDFGLGGTDHEQLAAMAARAVAYAPHVATGLPSALVDLAGLLRETGHRLPVRLVITYGEQLSEARLAELQDAYGAEVCDCYGLIELGPVAYRCSFGTYHVAGERCWVEILDEADRPVAAGQSGQIVVTSFTNYAMPLIRYATGDIGALGDGRCACGQAGQTIRVIEGRIPRDIELPSGERVNQIALVRILRKMDVDRFQIIQEDTDRVRVLATLGVSGGDADFAARFVPLAETALKGQVRVCADVVDERDFLRLPNGKVADFVPLQRSELAR